MAYGETYELFVEKFKKTRPKTTDDCYTPPAVYDAIAEWVANEYKLDSRDFVRPFWPDSDFRDLSHYPSNCVVVDNPPFSILASIVDFYLRWEIKFFLFAPTLTIFSTLRRRKACAIVLGHNDIIYHNEAKIHTSFLTNLEPETLCRTAPKLTAAIMQAQGKERKHKVQQYFPKNLIKSTDLSYMDIRGIDFRVPRDEAYFVEKLDYMQATKKEPKRRNEQGIFGGGFLISDALAESVVRTPTPDDAIKVPLSPYEEYIIAELNKAHTRKLDN